MDKAKILAKRIVSAQSTSVDTVSGATYSSNGIIHAVQNALKKAVKEKKQEDSSDTKDPQEETPAAVTGNFDYADGIYQGTGEGYGGDIKVSVVIQDKTIKAILITDHAGEDDSFFNRAKTITASMVASQTTDVDSVSGATYSSRGIIEAVKAAMEAAKNGNAQDGGNTDSDKQPEDTKDPTQDTDTSKESVYYGMVVCEPDEFEEFAAYQLHVRVTFQNGVISSVTDVYGDGGTANERYIAKAANGTSRRPGVATQAVTKNQAEEIDTVSGATCTSKALIKAIQMILTAAQKDGNYTATAGAALTGLQQTGDSVMQPEDDSTEETDLPASEAVPEAEESAKPEKPLEQMEDAPVVQIKPLPDTEEADTETETATESKDSTESQSGSAGKNSTEKQSGSVNKSRTDSQNSSTNADSKSSKKGKSRSTQT